MTFASRIADGVPIKDMLEIKEMLRGAKTKLIGPNTPGIITPGEARLGIFPENIHRPGRIGVVSRSSTLTYEAVIETNRAGLGQSTVIGLGDDMLIGIDFVETLEKFMNDPDTDAVVVIGQLGGTYEEVCAKYYKNLKVKKPVVGFVAETPCLSGTNGIRRRRDYQRARYRAGQAGRHERRRDHRRQ